MIFFDIETKSDLKRAYESGYFDTIKPDSRLKDPVKIENDLQDKKEKYLNNLPLHPFLAEIVIFGYYNLNHNAINILTTLPNTVVSANANIIMFGSERELLVETNKVLANERLCSYNGKAFDVPVICNRSIINGLGFSMARYEALTKKYGNHVHTDLSEMFNTSLDMLSGFFLNKKKEPIDFKTCPNNDLILHNIEDLMLLKEIYDVI